MKQVSLLRGIGVVSLAVIAAACSASQDVGDVDGQSAPGADVTALDNEKLTIIDSDEQGIPNFVVGALGKVSVTAGHTAVEMQRELSPVLVKAAPMLRLKAEEMTLARAHTDKEGDQHFIFQQYKNGLQVIGAEVAVHVREGVVLGVNGSARTDLETPTRARLDAATARAAVKSLAGDIKDVVVSDEATLAYKAHEDALELVYMVDLKGMRSDGTPVHDTVIVSGADGSERGRIPHIHTARNREVHNLNHGTALPGPVTRTETQGAVGETSVDTNFDRLGTVYDCYKNLFARDSFNGTGAKLVSSVHYSNKYNNAYWDGTQMVYGDGDGSTLSDLSKSLDVTAHELTHAVTSSTSNLTYSGESGGLNESWSDVLGNVCEWYGAGQPATPSANNFLVGEDVYTPGTAGDALRFMCDPAKDGGSADFWTSSVGSLDVHYSSGVSNLAFCLLVNGGTHPRGKSTVKVPALGMAKAAQVWYKAELIMTASTNFAGAKTATEQAATQLKLTTAEIASVTAAWQAVGVGATGGGGGGTCSHDKCTTGAALTSTCNSVVSAVCAADAVCCGTGGTWDATCVSEGRTIGKSLKCSEATGSCSHNLCTTGTRLTSTCDSAKANCAAKICAADSFCCSTSGSWDATCVAAVASVCGLNCN